MLIHRSPLCLILSSNLNIWNFRCYSQMLAGEPCTKSDLKRVSASLSSLDHVSLMLGGEDENERGFLWGLQILLHFS